MFGLEGPALFIGGGPPLRIDPTLWGARPGDTFFFSAGDGSLSGYAFSILINNSGATLVDHGDGTATYTAGTTTGVNDTVRVIDSLGAHADGIIQVRPPLAVTPPTTITVTVNDFYNFTATGGATQSFGLNWFVTTDGSGGATVSGVDTDFATGQYQAGASPGTDIVSVFDNDGAEIDCTVHVVAVSVSPSPVTVPPQGSQLFTASAGTAPYTFAYTQNNSAGSLVDNGDGTASYTAGIFPDVVDIVEVTDNNGNVADATINVGDGVSTTPAAPISISPGNTQLFTAIGGSGTGYSFSAAIFSGGTFVDHGNGTATYTAGNTSNTIDLIDITDSLGNQYELSINVPGPRISPATPKSAVPHQTILFSVTGGVAPWTFSIGINHSGASIVDHGDGTATYTAGDTGSVNDTVDVQDSGGNGDLTLVLVGPALTISPSVSTVPPGGSETFSHTGGGAPFTYSLHVNNSGSSINASTGVYTAGHTGDVTDIVRVTDTNSATADATVTVTASLAIHPSAIDVNKGASLTFTRSGGSGIGDTFSLIQNQSGGTVNSSTGLYTSGTGGGNPAVDIVQVSDNLGNSAQATISAFPPPVPNFFVQGVTLIGLSTLRVRFTFPPRALNPDSGHDALHPANYVLSGNDSTYVIAALPVLGDPKSIDCLLASPLSKGQWTLSARNILSSDGTQAL